MGTDRVVVIVGRALGAETVVAFGASDGAGIARRVVIDVNGGRVMA